VIDRIEVEWAGGGRSMLEDVPVDSVVRIGGDPSGDLSDSRGPSDSETRPLASHP
jgi:hypothetical protein